MSQPSRRTDLSFYNDSANIVDQIEEEQSFRNTKNQTDLVSENVRLQNLSIFTTLKKNVEELDSKNCQICKKNHKEILWFFNEQILRLFSMRGLYH